MFDIGWPEMAIVVVVALIILGPKDLPRAIRTVNLGVKKLRSMAAEIRAGMNEIVREAELGDLKKELEGIGRETKDDILRAAKEEKFAALKAEETDPTGGAVDDPALEEIAEGLSGAKAKSERSIEPPPSGAKARSKRSTQPLPSGRARQAPAPTVETDAPASAPDDNVGDSTDAGAGQTGTPADDKAGAAGAARATVDK